jgi:sugar (pentulose or hexulose) kinase
VEHYDPSYDRSMRRNFAQLEQAPVVRLEGTDDTALGAAAAALKAIGSG